MLRSDNTVHSDPNIHLECCDEGVQEVKVTADAVKISQEWQDKLKMTHSKEEGIKGSDKGGGAGENVGR